MRSNEQAITEIDGEECRLPGCTGRVSVKTYAVICDVCGTPVIRTDIDDDRQTSTSLALD